MITSIEGLLSANGIDWVDVSIGGITLRVQVPSSAIEIVGKIGDRVRLLTYLQSKDDGLSLFGFLTEEMRSAFEMLISVNGVGPRSALSVLSNLSPEALAAAVASGDTRSFKGIHGIGTKTASRIVLELKGKLVGINDAVTLANNHGDVLDALMALGYTLSEARVAVAALPFEEGVSLEDEVRICILRLGEQ